MSRELRRAGGRLSFGGLAVALLVGAAGCEEQLAVRPGYDHQPAVGGAGGGGLGGEGGEGGGAAGGGGGAGGAERKATIDIGSCNPDQVQANCDVPYGGWDYSWSCQLIDGEWRYVATDCAKLGLGCEPTDGECHGPLPACSRPCELGQIVCADSYGMRSSCQPYDNPDIGPCFGYLPYDHCPDGTVCYEAECVPTCVSLDCDCPPDHDAACGADGRIWWNDCLRACAGAAPGTSCELEPPDLVWTTPIAAHGVAALSGGVVLLSEFMFEDAEHERLSAYESSAYRVGPFLPGPAPAATRLWRGLTDTSSSLQSVPLPDGRTFVYGHGLSEAFIAADEQGFETIARHPSVQFNTGSSLFATDQRLLFHTFRRLLSLDRDNPTELRLEATYPHEYELYGWASTWGYLLEGDQPTLVTTSLSQVNLHRVDPAAPAREFVYRMQLERIAINAVRIWEQAGERGVLVYGGLLRGDTGEKVFILVDLVWDGACMHQRARLEYVTADSRASGGLSTGDLDGDGDDEVAFATGETTFVLDRDENNRLFVRGELPFDRPGMVEPYILDGDGDGDGELWLMNYPGGGSTPPPPSTVWMLPR